MAKSKKNIIGVIQHWMSSRKGQLFLHYTYNWGAAVVILGTLFKLNHLPSANMFLYIGMGTEIFVFFISAFDVPAERFDTATGDKVGEQVTDWETALKEQRELSLSATNIRNEMDVLHGQLKVINGFFERLTKAFVPGK